MKQDKMYPIEEALKAQRSLRDAAGLAPEQFPLQAFVGMVSDEIQALRTRGTTDQEIAAIIERSSSIQISALEIAAYYASLRSAATTENSPAQAPSAPAADNR